MILLDAQLSPHLAPWMSQTFGIDARAARDLNLRDAEDADIFSQARQLNAIVMTKDADFISLLKRLGPPPQIIWLTCGNTSNAHLKSILAVNLASALALLEQGEPLVEIRGN